jgi:DNA-binding NtrC family response regulator
MARPRNKTLALGKLLDSTSRPIYVLDEEYSLVFCNSACLEWVGHSADELLGKQCRYHSDPEVTEVEAVAAGLCPPPAAMTGRQLTGTVVKIDHQSGRLARRRARFVPLADDPEDPLGLIVLVDGADPPDSQFAVAGPATDQTETDWLHERVRAYRRELGDRYRVDRIVGDSPAMQKVRSQVALASNSRTGVLIVGPAGSGRQHVARSIHYGDDPLAAGALIPLACGLLGEDLIHSTVAALAAKDPRPEKAGRSTLLLNDIDQLPVEIQGELARVLGEKTFPLRLIATAGGGLADAVRQGTLRNDLASLLSTIVIELPPLAERREDLPALLQLFAERLNADGKKQVAGFSPEALDMLDAHQWKGNIDELARVVAQSHKNAEGAWIGPVDLPEGIHLGAEAAAHPPRKEETIVLDEFLGRIERELISRALAQAKGNKTKTAKLLGMTRPRLYRRLVQLGLIEKEK